MEKLNTKNKQEKKPREAKPKLERKVLDLTINDNEIKNIIENKDVKPKTQPDINPILKAFLDALQKN